MAIVREFVGVALNTMSLPRDVLQGLEWSLNEVMDNVLIHAQVSRGGFVQAMTLEDRVAFTVADCGRGVLASLREAYPNLVQDTEAIGEAVKAGVTRNPEIGQGNGLAGTLRIATQTGGSFAMTSGCGILNVFPIGLATESHGRLIPHYQAFPGTIVNAQIIRNPLFKLSDALGFTQMIGGHFDLIEAVYETEDGSSFMVNMRSETVGFGSREAGRQIRTKIKNLLESAPAKPVLINWEGVPVISSSFADEAIGKLFVELGPTEFSSRVRNSRMEGLVRGLIDKAILQRTVQSMDQATKSQPPANGPIRMDEAPLPEA